MVRKQRLMHHHKVGKKFIAAVMGCCSSGVIGLSFDHGAHFRRVLLPLLNHLLNHGINAV